VIGATNPYNVTNTESERMIKTRLEAALYREKKTATKGGSGRKTTVS